MRHRRLPTRPRRRPTMRRLPTSRRRLTRWPLLARPRGRQLPASLRRRRRTATDRGLPTWPLLTCVRRRLSAQRLPARVCCRLSAASEGLRTWPMVTWARRRRSALRRRGVTAALRLSAWRRRRLAAWAYWRLSATSQRLDTWPRRRLPAVWRLWAAVLWGSTCGWLAGSVWWLRAAVVRVSGHGWLTTRPRRWLPARGHPARVLRRAGLLVWWLAATGLHWLLGSAGAGAGASRAAAGAGHSAGGWGCEPARGWGLLRRRAVLERACVRRQRLARAAREPCRSDVVLWAAASLPSRLGAESWRGHAVAAVRRGVRRACAATRGTVRLTACRARHSAAAHRRWGGPARRLAWCRRRLGLRRARWLGLLLRGSLRTFRMLNVVSARPSRLGRGLRFGRLLRRTRRAVRALGFPPDVRLGVLRPTSRLLAARFGLRSGPRLFSS